ncbi:DNA polymerase IV [mine drainage metagenome]|uniref:DNA polymerase IV n=1 Tax=mine drainage metagenome TaxID=410659 RepID=A0A1J5PCW8_9ZZZZ
MQRKGYVGKTIGIKLRYDDFKSVTRDQTLALYSADARVIRQTAGLCLKRVPLNRRLRLLGVRVGSLMKAGNLHEHETNRPESPDDKADAARISIAKTDQLF